MYYVSIDEGRGRGSIFLRLTRELLGTTLTILVKVSCSLSGIMIKKKERKIRKIGCVTTALCDIHKGYARLLIAGDVVKEYLQLK